MKTIENVKQFWDDRPCNVRHSKKKLAQEYFDEVEKKKLTVNHILKLFQILMNGMVKKFWR